MSGENLYPPPGIDAGATDPTQFFGSLVLGVVVFAIPKLVNYWWSLRQASQATESAVFDQVLASGDLHTIGRHLKHVLGGVSAAAYVSNAEIRQRVDRSIGRISTMVALPKPDEQALESLIEPSADPQTPPALPIADAAQNLLNEARSEISAGKSWNGLFAIRRDLEMRLRSLAGVSDVRPVVRPRFSDPAVASEYRRFFNIASRAIHGDQITDEEAQQALTSAAKIYAALEGNDPISH